MHRLHKKFDKMRFNGARKIRRQRGKGNYFCVAACLYKWSMPIKIHACAMCQVTRSIGKHVER